MFGLTSTFSPTGDQPQAIDALVGGVKTGLKNQVLLGVTGSGKTFTMANVIAKLGYPALIISHNKTLAGQLYQEIRDFFPNNAVSYFVSYYDYYQPEAYIPQTDTYIEKEAEINELIDKLRLQATTNILTRKDTIVVASVSCIYNIGSPVEYGKFILPLTVGDRVDWLEISRRLIALHYERSEFEFKRGTFRMRGAYMDVYPAYEDRGYRISESGGTIVSIIPFDPISGKEEYDKEQKIVVFYPAKHYMMNPAVFKNARHAIRADLKKESEILRNSGKLIEAHRLTQKVNYDLELIEEVGYVNGIENYSRYFDGRKPGDPPHSLLDYFTEAYGRKFLTFIDESHMTVSQLRGMYNGDHARKQTLIDFGFRLQSAFDNRPLRFEEFYKIPPHIIYVSATPNDWEQEMAQSEAKNVKNYDGIAQQLIRPTGIVDPKIMVRPAKTEITDLIEEIIKRTAKKERVLVTTLTKKTAEDLSEYLKEKNIRASYLHSDIHTLERSDVLDSLRNNTFDVLIGVNLLREGLDLPEVTLVAILDADREGFLRSRTSLIQTMGRAARNIEGEVILYADTITKSIKQAIDEISRRRAYQLEYNKKHHITPVTIHKPLREKIVVGTDDALPFEQQKGDITEDFLNKISADRLTAYDKKKLIKKLEKEMKRQAQEMHFEMAIRIRDRILALKNETL